VLVVAVELRQLVALVVHPLAVLVVLVAVLVEAQLLTQLAVAAVAVRV
jgi:hypothetical protein